MSSLSPSDYLALQVAAKKLETQSFAMKIAAGLGVPIEALLHMLTNRHFSHGSIL
jgi:hypothetical protein